MKRILLFFVSVTLVLSCSKEEEPTIRMDFTYDGNTYALAKTFIEDWGVNGDNQSRDYDLLVTSSSITYNSNSSSYSGIGDVVYLDLNSASTTEFIPGNFVWSSTRGPNTIVDGAVGIGINTESFTGGTVEEFTAGTVTVTKEGDNYTVSFNCTTASGKEVSGSWTGIMTSTD